MTRTSFSPCRTGRTGHTNNCKCYLCKGFSLPVLSSITAEKSTRNAEIILCASRFPSANRKIGIWRVNHPRCHPERAQRVEGSSHLFCAVQWENAKILRLRATRFAQDDNECTNPYLSSGCAKPISTKRKIRLPVWEPDRYFTRTGQGQRRKRCAQMCRRRNR